MLEAIKKNRKLVIFEAIVFILLGIFAIALPNIFTLGIELLVGWILLIGGVIQTVRSFKAKGKGFWLSLLTGLLAIIIGVLLLFFPLRGILTLTLLLTIFFLFEGIAKITMAIQMRKQVAQWGWLLLSGILALAIAFIVWSAWPSSAFWVIGLLVGINMLFFGFSLLMLATNHDDDSQKPSMPV